MPPTASVPILHSACHVCGHLCPETVATECVQCGSKDRRAKGKSARATLVFSLTALIFYYPAMIFPFMTIELYGNRNTSTVWGGIVSLAEAGSLTIALIVFLASILIPLLKLVILFYLGLTARNGKRRKFKTSLYHFVEAIGRWSMLDIFLLAVLVAIMKLGPWTTVRPGIGAIMFALVVVFTMIASAFFDARLLWEPGGEAGHATRNTDNPRNPKASVPKPYLKVINE